MPRLSRRARRARQRALRRRCGVFALAFGSLAALTLPARADVPPPAGGQVPNTATNNPIFDAKSAPVIILRIGVHRIVLVPRSSGNSTAVTGSQLEHENVTNLSDAISHNVAGVAAAPSGEIHVRGSHGQYTYYLDGAPLPSNVNGSFSDLINPKDIETLRVFDGGFPAEYGGELAAVFDVTTRGGSGKPSGYVQQLAQSYGTYIGTAEVGGSEGRSSYFFSGVQHSSDFYLSPVTQTPLHDSGLEDIGFGKLVYQLAGTDKVTLDVNETGASVQIPNTPDRQDVGQNDTQKENSDFANLIWRHGVGDDALNVALYSHASHLRYFGSPQDLLPGPAGSASADASALDETFQDESGDYYGLRTDKKQRVDSTHQLQYGVDVDQVTGHQNFVDIGADPVSDQRKFSGSDRSAYIQDDWTPGRFLINYGARYDIHQADIISSQLSPRLNATYHLSPHDDVHADYDRLFQPVSIEDVIKLSEASSVPIQPERDDFFETGIEHRQGGATMSVDAYYRAEKNAVDDATFANTQIDIPENFAKGYARGLEFSVDGALNKSTSYYLNYARSWAKEAGPVSGGLLAEAPSSYFYDDHDQTNTASFGLAYDSRGTYANFDGEYGSGFTFGETDETDSQGQPVLDSGGSPIPSALNFLRTHPHTTFNMTVGHRGGSVDLAFVVDNILNHAYVIKQAGAFSDTQWAEGRSYGVKLTVNF
jgi:hypothetical protein